MRSTRELRVLCCPPAPGCSMAFHDSADGDQRRPPPGGPCEALQALPQRPDRMVLQESGASGSCLGRSTSSLALRRRPISARGLWRYLRLDDGAKKACSNRVCVIGGRVVIRIHRSLSTEYLLRTGNPVLRTGGTVQVELPGCCEFEGWSPHITASQLGRFDGMGEVGEGGGGQGGFRSRTSPPRKAPSRLRVSHRRVAMARRLGHRHSPTHTPELNLNAFP